MSSHGHFFIFSEDCYTSEPQLQATTSYLMAGDSIGSAWMARQLMAELGGLPRRKCAKHRGKGARKVSRANPSEVIPVDL